MVYFSEKKSITYIIKLKKSISEKLKLIFRIFCTFCFCYQIKYLLFSIWFCGPSHSPYPEVHYEQLISLHDSFSSPFQRTSYSPIRRRRMLPKKVLCFERRQTFDHVHYVRARAPYFRRTRMLTNHITQSTQTAIRNMINATVPAMVHG